MFERTPARETGEVPSVRPGRSRGRGLPVQAKMVVGAAHDRYEQEADRVAQAVLARLGPEGAGTASEASPAATAAPPGSAQRVSHVEGDGRQEGGALHDGEERAIRSARGGGRPLDDQVRARMERGFGVDLSGVRVHTDARADRLNRSMASEALTTGRDIFFRSGNYRPTSRSGAALLAHELTHTLQQGAVGTTRRRLRPEAADAACVAASSGAPDVQAAWGPFGTKRVPGNGATKKAKFPKIEAVVAKAKAGAATREEIDAAKQMVEAERAKAKKLKDKDKNKEPRLRALRFLYDDLDIALDHLNVADTKQEAKDIYLEAGKKKNVKGFGLRALWPGNKFFKKGPTEAGKRTGAEAGLDDAEMVALGTYMSRDYRYINPAVAFDKKWLKGQVDDWGVSGPKTSEFMEEGGLHAGMMMQAFAKLPVWKGDGWRGERLTPEEFSDQFRVDGSTVTAKKPKTTRTAFWSVSTRKNIAEGFAGSNSSVDRTVSVLYRVAVNNARDIRTFSNFPEGEVLCPPGSTTTITSVEALPRGDKGSPPATAWYVVDVVQT